VIVKGAVITIRPYDSYGIYLDTADGHLAIHMQNVRGMHVEDELNFHAMRAVRDEQANEVVRAPGQRGLAWRGSTQVMARIYVGAKKEKD
jgi:hypothetical protein